MSAQPFVADRGHVLTRKDGEGVTVTLSFWNPDPSVTGPAVKMPARLALQLAGLIQHSVAAPDETKPGQWVN